MVKSVHGDDENDSDNYDGDDDEEEDDDDEAAGIPGRRLRIAGLLPNNGTGKTEAGKKTQNLHHF